MSILPLSEVKSRLSEIADEVDRTHDRVHVTRNGREYIVLMAAQDLSTIEATLELFLAEHEAQVVAQAEAEFAAGVFTTGEEMHSIMQMRRTDGS